jgi:hypothetical protein
MARPSAFGEGPGFARLRAASTQVRAATVTLLWLDLRETTANAQVAGFLFTAVKNGNVTAQIFWLKTRAR